jgi:hypothetical protein
MLVNNILFLILATLLSCQSESQQGDYENYLAKFKSVELPLSISNSTLEESLPNISTALDSSDVVSFIESNRTFEDGMSLIDIYKFYPYAQFRISDELDGVIVLKSGGAGGVETIFNLLVYNNSGEQVEKMIFAKEIGDCSRLQVLTGELSLNLEITTENTLLVSDCESDEYEIKSFQVDKYKINAEGYIKKL